MARLLVVEDRDSLRRMLERALAEAGHSVRAVADAPPARARRSPTESFDLVLTDLKLPGGSGLDVLAAARARRPPPPVVVMTAYGTVGAAVEAMKLGAADFLEKPVELDALYRLVGELAGGAPPARGLRAPRRAADRRRPPAAARRAAPARSGWRRPTRPCC